MRGMDVFPARSAPDEAMADAAPMDLLRRSATSPAPCMRLDNFRHREASIGLRRLAKVQPTQIWQDRRPRGDLDRLAAVERTLRVVAAAVETGDPIARMTAVQLAAALHRRDLSA